MSLYPNKLDRSAAQQNLEWILGAGLVEESIAGKSVWVRPCVPAAPAGPCNDTFAVWHDNRLIFIEFGPASSPMTARPLVTQEMAREFVRLVVEGIG